MDDSANLYDKKLQEILAKDPVTHTDDDRKILAMEKHLCKGDFLRFLRHVKIVEAPTPANPGGIIEFKLWDHTKQIIAAFLTKRLISILKSRQVGASWAIGAYVLWYAMSKQGANWLLFSKGELEATELLAKCKRIYKFLPPFLQLKINPDSATEIGFPTMMSSIKAMAATETAGISFTASGIVCDEHEEHPYAEANYMAAKPTVDAGGQFISIFTSSTKGDTLAKSLFRGALEGKNGFTPLFFPYTVRPGRDEKWYEDTKKSIPDTELSALTPELFMRLNYPRTIEEALAPPQTIAAFDAKVLEEMMGETKSPVKVTHEGIGSKLSNIYQQFHIGDFYVAGTDVAHGGGKDYSVTAILNVRTGAVVADVFSNLIPPEELAYESCKLLEYFKSPLWFIENNEWGMVTITTAEGLGYKHLGYTDRKRTKLGWHTDEKSRYELFGGLIPAVNNRQITIFNARGLKQFFDLIRNVNKNGRIEAMTGGHDDYPVAVGICWNKKDEVQTNAYKLKPIQTLTFGRG